MQHRKQPDKAQGAYEMALVMVTDQQQHLAILESYANLLLSEQRWDEALELANEALELAPNDSSIWTFIKWSPIKEKALGRGKHKVEWLKEGNNLLDLNRFDEALVAYDHVLQIDPNYTIAYNNKGSALDSLNRFDEALVAFDHAIQLNPNLAVAYYNKGITLKKMN